MGVFIMFKIIIVEDDKEIRGMINDYLSERIYHFNFYREFFDLIDSAPEEYELDYNQLLSIATLDNVFYTDKLFNYVKKKDQATTLYHTPLHNEGISSQMTNYDSSFMACRESVDLLNYIYYPVIFTLSYSLVKNNLESLLAFWVNYPRTLHIKKCWIP